MLVHYNPDVSLKLDCDASGYGVGAVLLHIFPTGVERPIAYASRTLTQSEKGYSQLEKEALCPCLCPCPCPCQYLMVCTKFVNYLMLIL